MPQCPFMNAIERGSRRWLTSDAIVASDQMLEPHACERLTALPVQSEHSKEPQRFGLISCSLSRLSGRSTHRSKEPSKRGVVGGEVPPYESWKEASVVHPSVRERRPVVIRCTACSPAVLTVVHRLSLIDSRTTVSGQSAPHQPGPSVSHPHSVYIDPSTLRCVSGDEGNIQSAQRNVFCCSFDAALNGSTFVDFYGITQ